MKLFPVSWLVLCIGILVSGEKICSANDETCQSLSSYMVEIQNNGIVEIKNALSETFMAELANYSAEWTSSLDELSVNWKTKPMEADGNTVLCYRDVVQREPGKLEIKLPQLQYKHIQTQLEEFAALTWGKVAKELLGDDCELLSVTLALSLSESPIGEPAINQSVHADGSYENKPYAVVVYIPLEDVPENGGRVEYFPGSHNDIKWFEKVTNEEFVEMYTKEGKSPIFPEMQKGDALVYDFRLQHRGLARLISEGQRPILKMDYFRKGRDDTDNSWCDERGDILVGPCAPYIDKHARENECKGWFKEGYCDKDNEYFLFMNQKCQRTCCVGNQGQAHPLL